MQRKDEVIVKARVQLRHSVVSTVYSQCMML